MNSRLFPINTLPILNWALAICIAVLFATAAIPKILSPAEFAEVVWGYSLLPDQVVNIAAIYLPWLELVCAICLLLAPRSRQAAYALLATLMLLFTVATAFNLLRGISTPCGCFGSSDSPATWWTVGRNCLILTLIGVAAWVNHASPTSKHT